MRVVDDVSLIAHLARRAALVAWDEYDTSVSTIADKGKDLSWWGYRGRTGTHRHDCVDVAISAHSAVSAHHHPGQNRPFAPIRIQWRWAVVWREGDAYHWR
jgi:hypothetical protein